MLKLDCSNGSVLDGQLESSLGNRLLLAGPITDDFLKEIGLRIQAKLSRGKLTGLLPQVKIFIPPSILSKVLALCVGYGGGHEPRVSWKREKTKSDKDDSDPFREQVCIINFPPSTI